MAIVQAPSLDSFPNAAESGPLNQKPDAAASYTRNLQTSRPARRSPENIAQRACANGNSKLSTETLHFGIREGSSVNAALAASLRKQMQAAASNWRHVGGSEPAWSLIFEATEGRWKGSCQIYRRLAEYQLILGYQFFRSSEALLSGLVVGTFSVYGTQKEQQHGHSRNVGPCSAYVVCFR